MSGLEIGVHFHPHIRPIVKTRALEQLVGNAKTKRFDKIKRSMGSRAGSGYIPGVLGYFRLVEQNCRASG